MIRIYAASLSDYNNGILHGAWIEVTDANGDKDHLLSLIQERVLETSPTAKEDGQPAEEFGIFDYDSDCSGLSLSQYGEYPDLQELIDIDTALEDTNADPEAIAAFLDIFSISDLSSFDDRYRGHFDSDEDFAWDMIDASCLFDGVPDYIQRYFDIEAYARDLMFDGFSSSNGYYFYTY